MSLRDLAKRYERERTYLNSTFFTFQDLLASLLASHAFSVPGGGGGGDRSAPADDAAAMEIDGASGDGGGGSGVNASIDSDRCDGVTAHAARHIATAADIARGQLGRLYM